MLDSPVGLEPLVDQPLVRYEDVSVTAGGVQILSNVTLSLTSGAPTVLLGPNGSGKTTLLKLAMGLIDPTSGHVTLAPHHDAGTPRRAFVFQKPVMLRRSVAANVAFALTAAGYEADLDMIDHLLAQVGLRHLADRPARRLSGGEQQRLALARALARCPAILFLDEPTAHLDPAATKAVEDIVATIAASGVKVVMATHDLGQARRLACDIVFLANGELVEHAASETFFAHPSMVAAQRFLAGDLVL